jgi:hypothetical protein
VHQTPVSSFLANNDIFNIIPMSDVGTEDRVGALSSACEEIIESYLAGKIRLGEVEPALRRAGASAAEAKSYLDELDDNSRFRESDGDDVRVPDNDKDYEEHAEDPPIKDSTKPQSAEERLEADREAAALRAFKSREDAVNRAEWADFNARLSNLGHQGIAPFKQGSVPPLSASAFLATIGNGTTLNSPPRPIPSTSALTPEVFAAIPSLTGLVMSMSSDPIVQKTWKTRQVLSGDRVADQVIDVLQAQPLREPLPRAIWKDILADKYIDFEKLFAALDKPYERDTEPKVITGDFAIIRKDMLHTKKPVTNEGEWKCLFDAWYHGVIKAYDHRKDELYDYGNIVMEYFRASPNPSIAIQFDAAARSLYAKMPFNMSDRLRLAAPALSAQLSITGPSSVLPAKRPAAGYPTPLSPSKASKRAKMVCENWNAGRCDEPCINLRRHGDCSECGEKHRARDKIECLTLFQARRAKRFTEKGRSS